MIVVVALVFGGAALVALAHEHGLAATVGTIGLLATYVVDVVT